MLLLELSLIFLLILLNGFFSAAEISLISLRRSRVRHLVKSGNPIARRIQKLQEEPERALCEPRQAPGAGHLLLTANAYWVLARKRT